MMKKEVYYIITIGCLCFTVLMIGLNICRINNIIESMEQELQILQETIEELDIKLQQIKSFVNTLDPERKAFEE